MQEGSHCVAGVPPVVASGVLPRAGSGGASVHLERCDKEPRFG